MIYLRVTLRRFWISMIQSVFDCPFLWQPPMHRFKAAAYRFLLGVHFKGECLIHSGVRILNPGNLVIGNYCSLVYGCIIECRNKVAIGDNTIIGPQAFITAGGHAPADLSPTTRSVSIGKNVFIGARAMILQGVRIGDNSIVGAGAVVVKDVPPNTVVGGVPAHEIRRLERAGRIWTGFGEINCE